MNKFKTFIFLSPLLFILLLGASCNSSNDGGIFMSLDQAQTWEQKNLAGYTSGSFFSKSQPITNNGINVSKIVQDSNNPDTIYYGSYGNGIYKTTDKAELWALTGLTSGNINDLAINKADPTIIFAAQDQNIIRSVDSGETWEIIHTDPENQLITSIVLDWYNTENIFATSQNGSIIKSSDSGDNWNIIYQETEPLIDLAIDYYDSRIIYVINEDEELLKTSNSGEEWVILTDKDFYKDGSWPFTKKGILSITTDPSNTNKVFAVSNAGIAVSSNAGDTWDIVNTLIPLEDTKNKSISNITIHPENSKIVYFTVDNIIHKSIDGGKNWQTIETFPSARLITSLMIDQDNQDLIFAGTREAEKKGGFVTHDTE
ncbi:MAG: hypothetical protein ABID45_01285 [Patescibacteria group bacterium]